MAARAAGVLGAAVPSESEDGELSDSDAGAAEEPPAGAPVAQGPAAARAPAAAAVPAAAAAGAPAAEVPPAAAAVAGAPAAPGAPAAEALAARRGSRSPPPAGKRGPAPTDTSADVVVVGGPNAPAEPSADSSAEPTDVGSTSPSRSSCSRGTPSPPRRRDRRRRRASRSRSQRPRRLRRRRGARSRLERGRRRKRSPSVGRTTESFDVYIGNLGAGSKRDVQNALIKTFKQLPEYQSRYGSLRNPITRIYAPNSSSEEVAPIGHNFVFVSFADETLAATAVALTGMRICGRSVKIHWSEASLAHSPPNAAALDVESLREAGKIPWSRQPGATMQTRIWAGALPEGAARRAESLVQLLERALLKVPEIKAAYPDMTRPVLEAKMANAGAWAFVELATEQLASTAVALRSIKFDDGTNAVIGWPGQGKDAERHAAPSLLVRTAQLKLQDADTGALERGGGAGEAPAAEQSYRSDPFEERNECTVYIGNTCGVDDEVLWDVLLQALVSLSSYQQVYPPNGPGPIVYMRCGFGGGTYAFAHLRDPVLASTAVALSSLPVAGKRVYVERPAKEWQPSDGMIAPPLEIGQGGQQGDVQPPPQKKLKVPTCGEGPQRTCEGMLYITNLEKWGTSISEARQDLDDFLNEAVFAKIPDFDLEAGPPLRKCTLHRSGNYAYLQVRDITDEQFTQRLMNIFDGLKYRGRSIQCRPCTIPQVIATDLEKKGASRKEQSDQPATASAVPSVQEDTQGGTADAPRTTEAAAARFEEQVEKDGSIPMEVVHCKSDVCIGEQADVDDARTTDVVDTRIDEQAEVDDAITTEVLHRKPDLSIEEQAMVNDAVTTESVDCTPRARVEDDPT